jgi:hypothetical protein
VALASLVLRLIAAAALLAPWKLKFSVDAMQLYDELYGQAAKQADERTLGWNRKRRLPVPVASRGECA